MEALIKINGAADKDAINEARGAINDILKAAVDNTTKVAALQALQAIVVPPMGSSYSITNCNFDAPLAQKGSRK